MSRELAILGTVGFMTTTFVGVVAIVALTLIGVGMNAGLIRMPSFRRAAPPLVPRSMRPALGLNRQIGSVERAPKAPADPEED